jgi:hypothetical protein
MRQMSDVRRGSEGLDLPDWRVSQKFYSPNQIQTRQNPVFAEHLYSVHFVYIRPTRKVDHHDCVCVIIINKSPCQVCVWISESGRNKTQLAGKKGLTKRENYSPIPNSTRIWRVVISTPVLVTSSVINIPSHKLHVHFSHTRLCIVG